MTEAHERRSSEIASRLLGEGVPDAQLDKELFLLWSISSLEPVAGSLDELISSGQLRLVRDEGLRATLAAWNSHVEHYRRREGWAQDNWNLFGAPYVMREMSLAQLAGEVRAGVPANVHPRDHFALLGDPYFQNLVMLRWLTADDILASLEPLRAEADLIIERLETWLARS